MRDLVVPSRQTQLQRIHEDSSCLDFLFKTDQPIHLGGIQKAGLTSASGTTWSRVFWLNLKKQWLSQWFPCGFPGVQPWKKSMSEAVSAPNPWNCWNCWNDRIHQIHQSLQRRQLHWALRRDWCLTLHQIGIGSRSCCRWLFLLRCTNEKFYAEAGVQQRIIRIQLTWGPLICSTPSGTESVLPKVV